MSKQSKIWGWLLGAACIGCCAVPLYLLAVGATAGITSLVSPALREILICVVPLLLIAVTFYAINKKKKSCCESQGKNCTSNQCGLDRGK